MYDQSIVSYLRSPEKPGHSFLNLYRDNNTFLFTKTASKSRNLHVF